MELLHWGKVDRKRLREIPYNHEDFVLGYDLDMTDFTSLVEMFNRRSLTAEGETRLYNYVRTMISIVFENPQINPRSKAEKEDCADYMFVDCWNALKYIKAGRSPYSYIYRAGFTAACRYYKKKIAERNKQEAIQRHLWECFRDYQEAQSDGKVCNVNVD